MNAFNSIHGAACAAVLLVGAVAAPRVSLNASSEGPALDAACFVQSVVQIVSKDPLPSDAPEWCRSEDQLDWRARAKRVADRATLRWAKEQVKELRVKGEEVPKWMAEMVSKDEEKGRAKWAAHESRRLKELGQEVPAWMAGIVEEDSQWSNRWAACKAAELMVKGEEVPQWMRENGRKAVLQAAEDKLKEIQDEIDVLDEAKEKQAALVSARGDVNLAQRRLNLAKMGDEKSLKQIRLAEAPFAKMVKLAEISSSQGTRRVSFS